MRKILLFSAIIIFFFAASQIAEAGWWNESWHFRIPVNISFPSGAENASVNVSVNFTSEIESLGISGTFDKNSIRVVENNNDIPSDFLNTSIDAGNVSWIVNGTTPANTNRTFYIYFDIIENGAKSAGKVISESCNSYGNNTCYWRSDYSQDNMNVWSNQSSSPGIGYEWNRTWAQMIEVNWKWSAETNYDFAYLYIDGSQYSKKTGTGSETIQVSASRISARFTSDGSNHYPIYGSSDSYGIYGTAVDVIKFYPTAGYTTPAFNVFKATAEKQYPPTLNNASVSGDGWGETFNYSVIVNDTENDLVSVTLYTNENGVWNRHETRTTHGGMLNWTLSPFSCSDIGTRYYKFEYNDSYHAPVNTSNYSQTIGKDDIEINYYSGNASVNRESGKIPFGVKMRDIDNGAYVSSEQVSFWSYYSGAWNNIGANNTASDGTVIYNYNPNCSVSAGTHLWKANYSGACYKANGSSNFVFTVVGQLKEWLLQPPRIEYDLGDSILIRANLTDECSNPVTGASANFSLNGTAYQAVEEGSGLYNYSWDSYGKETGNYTITMNSSAVFYNFNSTSWLNWFKLVAGPPHINVSLNVSQSEQGTIVHINATAEDMSGLGINTVWVNITYPNSTVIKYNMTNISDVWHFDLNDTAQRGQYNVTVYATDNAGKTGNKTSVLKIYAKIINDILTVTENNIVTFKIRIHDLNNASLSNASVNLRFDDSSGWNVFNQLYNTGSNGRVEPVPQKDSLISGLYNWTASVTYNDTITGIENFNVTSGYFSVTASSGSTGGGITPLFFLYLVAPSEVATGNNLEITAVTANNTMNIDVDSIKASLYDSAGNLIVDNVNMTKQSNGVYYKNYTTSSSSNQGTWKWIVYATEGSYELIKTEYTRVVGGPFDVRNITVTDNTVPTLGISVIVENKGNANQDVTMEWNITRTDTNEQLAAGSDTILVNANSEKVYSITPSVSYVGEVKVLFIAHYSGTERAGAYSIFTTEKESAQQPPPAAGGAAGGGGGGGGGAVSPPANVSNVSAAHGIEIAKYPEEIELEKGWAKFITILVNNTGSGVLHNVYIKFLDIPQEWYDIQTPVLKTLNGSKQFLVKFLVPKNVKSGNYKARLMALSSESSDEKEIIVRVYTSRYELIKYQIETLKDRVKYIETLADKLEQEGVDMTAIKSRISDIRAQITTAEKYLENKRYDDASRFAKSIKKAIDALQKDLEEKYEQRAKQPKLPLTLILIILAAVVSIVCVAYLVVRIRRRETDVAYRNAALERIHDLKKMVVGKLTAPKIKGDMERTRKMLRLLNKEYEEGIITKETYEELKRINEERLLNLSKKMKDYNIEE